MSEEIEYKIRGTADNTAARETAGELRNVTDATKEGAAANVNAGAAAEQAGTGYKSASTGARQLGGSVRGGMMLGRAFSALMKGDIVEAFHAAAFAAKGFSLALKSAGIGLLIAGVIAAVSAFEKLKSKMEDAKKAAEELDKEIFKAGNLSREVAKEVYGIETAMQKVKAAQDSINGAIDDEIKKQATVATAIQALIASQEKLALAQNEVGSGTAEEKAEREVAIKKKFAGLKQDADKDALAADLDSSHRKVEGAQQIEQAAWEDAQKKEAARRDVERQILADVRRKREVEQQLEKTNGPSTFNPYDPTARSTNDDAERAKLKQELESIDARQRARTQKAGEGQTAGPLATSTAAEVDAKKAAAAQSEATRKIEIAEKQKQDELLIKSGVKVSTEKDDAEMAALKAAEEAAKRKHEEEVKAAELAVKMAKEALDKKNDPAHYEANRNAVAAAEMAEIQAKNSGKKLTPQQEKEADFDKSKAATDAQRDIRAEREKIDKDEEQRHRKSERDGTASADVSNAIPAAIAAAFEKATPQIVAAIEGGMRTMAARIDRAQQDAVSRTA